MKYRFFLTLFCLTGCILQKAWGYELAIAAIFKNEGPYLKEWIEYHRMVGAEHFWLYNDASTDNWEEVLQPYLEEGIIEVFDWPVPHYLNFIGCQIRAYHDALQKALGKTKWLALIDIDEFLLPINEKTVTECLDRHFSHAGALYVNWRNFGTGGISLQEGESVLFGLIVCSPRNLWDNIVGKSIVRPECVDINQVWNPHHFLLQPGKKYSDGDGNPIEFEGIELKFDIKVHDHFIRINHYKFRDENFFRNVKFERSLKIGTSKKLIWEQYHAYNKQRNKDMIHFICQKHPELYENFWKPRIYR